MLKRGLSNIIDVLLPVNIIFTFLCILFLFFSGIMTAYNSQFQNIFLIVCLISAVVCFMWLWFLFLCLIESRRINAGVYQDYK